MDRLSTLLRISLPRVMPRPVIRPLQEEEEDAHGVRSATAAAQARRRRRRRRRRDHRFVRPLPHTFACGAIGTTRGGACFDLTTGSRAGYKDSGHSQSNDNPWFSHV